jgi:hypothetical protein
MVGFEVSINGRFWVSTEAGIDGIELQLAGQRLALSLPSLEADVLNPDLRCRTRKDTQTAPVIACARDCHDAGYHEHRADHCSTDSMQSRSSQ